jgi:hypothetical protein
MGPKNGGVALGKLVKLFGNVACLMFAIVDALRIANGFLPVRLVSPLFNFYFIGIPSLMLPADLEPAPITTPTCYSFLLSETICGKIKASDLNYSTLYSISRILSSGTLVI